MEIDDGNHVRPAASPTIEFGHQLIYAQDSGLRDKCTLSMANNGLDIPQVRETCRASAGREDTVPLRASSLTRLCRWRNHRAGTFESAIQSRARRPDGRTS